MLTALIIVSIVLGINVLYTISCVMHIIKIQKELDVRLRVEMELQKMIVELAKHQQLMGNSINDLVDAYFKSKKSKYQSQDDPFFKSPQGDA
jgi:hypothetical protein